MIHIGTVIPKIIEKARIMRLERCRKLMVTRLAELEKVVDVGYDPIISRKIDELNERLGR